VLLGRGVGLGVIAGGEVFRGRASSASEWGHVSLDRNGPLCRCGRPGCVEAFLGAQSILDRWATLGGAFKGTGWGAIGELLEANAVGDHAAVTVVDEIVSTLGTSLGGLVNLYNPERVIIGGWVGMRLMEQLAERIEVAARSAALQQPGSQFTLLPCTFGGDSVALGAAIMPLELLVSAPLVADQSRAARALA
jgi:predicted NBD/HSP70 family sugar kinase